jgi:hypothetical protein
MSGSPRALKCELSRAAAVHVGGSQTSESAPRAVCHSGVQTGCLNTECDVSFVTCTDNEQETGQR